MHHPNVDRTAREDGFATAEAAIVLPSLLLFLTLCVGLVVAVGAELKCVDAAHEAARFAARGESDESAVAAGSRLAPAGAHITLTRVGPWVEAQVRAESRPLRLLPGIPLGATARAQDEQR